MFFYINILLNSNCVDTVNEEIILNNILGNIKKKQKIEVGDTIYGEIVVVKDNMVVVEINHAFDKVISPADVGIIFTKNIDTKFVEKPEVCFSKGDLIKAKVIEVGPYEYKMATNSSNLGVVRSVCKKCKTVINANNKVCSNCGSSISKKFAFER